MLSVCPAKCKVTPETTLNQERNQMIQINLLSPLFKTFPTTQAEKNGPKHNPHGMFSAKLEGQE